MIEQIILLLLLLLLSGFFSSAETALFSISRAKAKHLGKQKGKTNQLIQKMKENPHQLLSTILIGNNIVNVGASALATAIAINMFDDGPVGNAVGIATFIMTFLILIFGEILPKSVATRNNLWIAKLVIIPLYWLTFVFAPIIFILNFIPSLTGKIKRVPTVTEEELITIIDVGEEEGEIKSEEKELIHNIFEFDDTSASEIMTPRGDMFVIDVNQPLQLVEIIKTGFTRFPVIQGNIDQIIGIINIKDLFRHHIMAREGVNIKKIMHPPYFVPENIKIDVMLHHFKKRKHHIAILIDEHGGVSGLVTLEDVIEEIVGEIVDETDVDEPQIVKIGNQEWIIPGKLDVDEVNKEVNINIPESNEYDTFSGYVLERMGKIPKEREKIIIDGLQLTVKEMDGYRIKTLILKNLKDDDLEPANGEAIPA